MTVWKFRIEGERVRAGDETRPRYTADGCNEPFMGRYWCPKIQWFRRDPCPFTCRRECENYIQMCGCL